MELKGSLTSIKFKIFLATRIIQRNGDLFKDLEHSNRNMIIITSFTAASISNIIRLNWPRLIYFYFNRSLSRKTLKVAWDRCLKSFQQPKLIEDPLAGLPTEG